MERCSSVTAAGRAIVFAASHDPLVMQSPVSVGDLGITLKALRSRRVRTRESGGTHLSPNVSHAVHWMQDRPLRIWIHW